MKNEIVTVPLQISEILIRRLIGAIFLIYLEGLPEEMEEDVRHFISVTKGLMTIDNLTEKVIERLQKAGTGEQKASDIVDRLKIIIFLKHLYHTGLLLKTDNMGDGAPSDFIELICSNWMIVDEFFAVEAVSNIDEQVERFMQLRQIFIKDMPPKKAREHLIEATKCYVQGFYQASVIICRSVIEFVLEDELRKCGWNIYQLPGDPNDGLFQKMIKTAYEENILDSSARRKADSVRRSGNRALHRDLIFSREEALTCLNATQDVLKQVYR